MTTTSWKDPVTDAFSDPAAWDTGQVPVSTDDAVIPPQDGTSYAVVVLDGDSITIASLSITDTAVEFLLRGGQFEVTGNVDNDGDIEYQGVSDSSLTIDGNLTNSHEVALDLTNGTAGVHVVGTLINSGSVDVTAVDGQFVEVGGLDNTGGGLNLTGNADSGVAGQLVFQVDDTAPDTLDSAVSISGNAELDFSGGLITAIGSNGTLSLDGANAQINITGTAGFDSGIDLASNDGTINLAGGAQLTSSGDFENGTGTINIFVDPGAQTGSKFTVAGDFTNDSTGTVSIDSTGDATGSALEVDGLLTNDGELRLTNGAQLSAGGIENTGTIDIDSDDPSNSGSSVFVDGDFTNTYFGTVNIDTAIECGCSGGTPAGAGGSSLTITGTLDNAGYLTLGNYLLSGAASVSVGTFINEDSGVLDMESGVSLFTFDTGSTVAPTTLHSTLLIGGKLLYGSGAITRIGSDGTLVLDNGEVDLSSLPGNNSALALTRNDGSLGIEEGASYDTPGDFRNSGTLDIAGGNGAGSSFGVFGDLTNTGSAQITLDSSLFSGPGAGGSSLTVLGSFTNAGDAFFGGDNDDNTTVIVGGTFTNNGDLYLSGGFSTDGYTNTTTMTVIGAATDSGQLIVDEGATFSAASIEIKAGGVLDIFGSVSGAVTIDTGGREVVESSAAAPTINGGVLEIAPGGDVGSSPILFTGQGGVLQIDDTVMPTNEIDGFDPFNSAIDLQGVAFDSSTAQVTLLNDLTHTNVLEITEGGNSYDFQLDPTQDYTGVSFQAVSDGTAGGTLIICFAAGTLIRTPAGDVAVERLKVGDLVLTAGGARRPVKWLGHRTIDCRRHASPKSAWPVRIARDALGENRPERDLFVSPGHAIAVQCLDEVLIPAFALVNGATIAQVPVDRITYWHVELDSHDILVANGLPAESYLDLDNRSFFQSIGAANDVPPVARTHADFCRPLFQDGPLVDAVRLRLNARATDMGWSLAAEMDMHLLVDGRRYEATRDGEIARFIFPASARDVTLACTTFVPAHISGTDWRELGIAVTGVHVGDAVKVSRDIGLDDPGFTSGFHQCEGTHRWTNGRLHIPASFWAECEGAVQLSLCHKPGACRRWRAPTMMGSDAVSSSRVAQRA